MQLSYDDTDGEIDDSNLQAEVKFKLKCMFPLIDLDSTIPYFHFPLLSSPPSLSLLPLLSFRLSMSATQLEEATKLSASSRAGSSLSLTSRGEKLPKDVVEPHPIIPHDSHTKHTLSPHPFLT